MAFAFDEFVLDPDRRELRRQARPIALAPQAFDLLLYLVAHRGRVIGRDELEQAIWGGRIVTDAALTTRLNVVRRAIGDDGKAQRLIRTLSRKGLRFVGQVREMDIGQALASAPVRPPAPASSAGRAPSPFHLAELPVLAVLPITAITEGREERWFAAGLTEELTVALGRYRGLSVLGPASGVATLGREPGLDYALQGTVRRRGDQLRVTVQLTQPDTRRNLWGDSFTVSLVDDLVSEDAIVATIAGSIEPRLRLAEACRLPHDDRDATPHELHLRAYPIFSDEKENVEKSLCVLEAALALDPAYAPALADAAFCLQVLDINVGGRDRVADRGRAIALARKALQSDDPEPVATAAFVLAYFGEDMDEALPLLDHANAQNPNFSRGWYMTGMARLYAGQPEQAVECLETSIRLNPRDRLTRRNDFGIGLAHFLMGHPDAAVAKLRPVVREFPHWATPHAALAACHAHQGHLSDAQRVTTRLKSSDPVLTPNIIQFRDPNYRRLLMPGVKLAGA